MAKKVTENNNVREFRSKAIAALTFVSTLVFTSANAFAAPAPPAPPAGNVSGVDNALAFIAAWGWKLGGIIMFIGGFQLAMAFKNDDANGKTTGIRVLIAGGMITGLCVSYKTIFGI